MSTRPGLGWFALGLSYGLPAGVVAALIVSVVTDGTETAGRIGLFVAVAVALVAMTISKRNEAS